tara:strand:- start:229 stop:1029 length:801 start_codon:yes stop_codon:yes gene_type:complete
MKKILLVGAGHMGKSLLKSWIKSNIKNISIVDPILARKKRKIYNTTVYGSLNKINDINDFNVIFFAVKPQILNKAIIPYKKLSLKNKLIISIVAGKKTKYFERQFGKNVSVIRTMPNLPALVAKGVTCLFKNKNVNLGQKKLSEKLFKSVGDFFWVNNENYINKFTAISGSGPAYYYYFIECLKDAGLKIGLNNKIAYDIAEKTAIGSIHLLEKTKENASSLRKKIAIKGGTTEAAIRELQNNNKMRKIVLSGVNAAYKKAIKIGK